MVKDFYNADDISRVLPGKKDYISCIVNGVRTQIQKRLLLCNIREVYALFAEQYPEVEIVLTKFSELRPKECVLAGSNGTHSICVCKSHQNVKLKIEGACLEELTKNDEDISYLNSYKTILPNIVCDTPTSSCFLLECDNCKVRGLQKLIDILIKVFDDHCIDFVTYRSWVSTNRTKFLTCVDSVNDFIENLLTDLPTLLKHDFFAKQQAKYLSNLEKNLKPEEFLVKGDFSENFSVVIQDAIQSQYWAEDQITLHPFVIYYKIGDEVKHENFVVISEDLTHDANSVNLFIQKLIGNLKKKHQIEKLIDFTDGPASQ